MGSNPRPLKKAEKERNFAAANNGTLVPRVVCIRMHSDSKRDVMDDHRRRLHRSSVLFRVYQLAGKEKSCMILGGVISALSFLAQHRGRILSSGIRKIAARRTKPAINRRA